MASDLDNLIHLISKLPGFGPRSSKRVVLHLLKKKDDLMYPLAQAMINTADKTINCQECGNLDTVSPCNICTGAKRDDSTICVVEDVADLWALERSGVFNGRYHVLGGVLCVFDGIGPEELNIDKLVDRILSQNIKEVIIATNATVDGQTTAHYISDILLDIDVKVTKLAHGMPIGGELDYMDEGTLSAAIRSRK